MVVRYFHVVGVLVSPLETNPPLIVNPDAVLAFPVSRKGLESVSGRNPEIIQRHRRIQQVEFLLGLSLDGGWKFPGALPPEYLFGLPALKDLIMGEYQRNALLMSNVIRDAGGAGTKRQWLVDKCHDIGNSSLRVKSVMTWVTQSAPPTQVHGFRGRRGIPESGLRSLDFGFGIGMQGSGVQGEE